jgi:hypothetical protein
MFVFQARERDCEEAPKSDPSTAKWINSLACRFGVGTPRRFTVLAWDAIQHMIARPLH